MKASNASATIEFPDGVDVYDEDILDLEEPKAPKRGKNPIVLAEKRMEEQRRFALDIMSNPLADVTFPVDLIKPQSIYDMISSQNSDYEIYNRVLEIDCGTIIHTKNH